MTKQIIVTGKTVEAAIEAALKQLGLTRDDVSVEILSQGKTGFLGIGSQPARVSVSYEAPDEEEVPAAEPVVEKKAPVETKPEKKPAAPKAEKKPAAPKPEKKPEPKPEKKEEPAAPAAEAAPAPVVEAPEAGSLEEQIRNFLLGLLRHMDSEADVVITKGEENTYQVELVGNGLGGLIGRRGETLDAIQQLANYSINRNLSHRVRIHLDAENYREKREESLQRLARKTAAKVLKNRRNLTLEPMNAYERHVIHAALQDYHPNIITYSVGTEPNRRLVVSYTRGGYTGE